MLCLGSSRVHAQLSVRGCPHKAPPCAASFDLVHSGSETGSLHNQLVPSMEIYSRWQAHAMGSPVLDLLAGQGCCLSISQEQAVLSACGGMTRLTYQDKVHCVCVCVCAWGRPASCAKVCVL